MHCGENGILKGAEYATDKYQNKAEQEQNELAKIDDYIQNGREGNAINEQNPIFALVLGGKTYVNFESWSDNTKNTVTNKGCYIYIWSGGSSLYSNFHTYVDLTNYKTLYFTGNINLVNEGSGSVYISKSDSSGRNSDENIIRYTLLNTTLANYEVDISDLKGSYYVGVCGSNRYISLYNMWLEK